MKKLVWFALLACVFTGASAQSIKREGNVFIEQRDTTYKNNGTKTAYTYKEKDGKEYPIFLSKNGKAYIVKTSKKTGKQYPKYLPEVTKQLSK